MRINYNVSAMLSNNALANSDDMLAQSLERLSSGLKLNHAKDNPAGLAMAKRMNAQIEGVTIASQNASDGISVIETADGALTEVTEMLQRLNELAIHSANGILSDGDRQTIQDEVAQLKEEIQRVSENTQFNGQKLLNGEFAQKGYTDVEGIKVNYYSSDVSVKKYTIDNLTIEEELDELGNPTGYKTVDVHNGGITLGEGFPDGIDTFEVKDSVLTIKGDNGFELKLDLTDAELGSTAVEIDVKGIGAMRLQIGANEGQVVELEIPNVSLQNLGIRDIDMSTKEGAEDAIDRLEGAIAFVSSVRSGLGAYQNRLDSSINNLDITNENVTAAYSRLMDVDMAEEMTTYSTYQVMTQAGTSMLAQANERPAQILQLLQ